MIIVAFLCSMLDNISTACRVATEPQLCVFFPQASVDLCFQLAIFSVSWILTGSRLESKYPPPNALMELLHG